MKTRKLICIIMAGVFSLSAGISSIAFCQRKAEPEKAKFVNPHELRALSPQPEPPDKDIQKPEKEIRTIRRPGIKDGTPQPDPPNIEGKGKS